MRVAAVAAFSIHDHAAGKHKTAGEAAVVQRAQQDRGTEIIGSHIVIDVAEVAAEPDHRRMMAQRVDAIDRVAGEGRIGEIAPAVLGVCRKIFGLAVMGTWVQAVGDAHLVAAMDEKIDDMGSDESGTAGDEHAHLSVLRRDATGGEP